jgi:hypothetical protein
MKIQRIQIKVVHPISLAIAAALLAAPLARAAVENDDADPIVTPDTTVTTSISSGGGGSSAGSTASASGGGFGGGGQLNFRTVAMTSPAEQEAAWLGVAVSDTTEALSAQLGLKRGEGLVVELVSSNSPAAAIGLQKNDVLAKLDGEMLVDSVQLRKLVQMHAVGDTIKLEYFHAGKRESRSAQLVKMPADEASDGSVDPFGRFRQRLSGTIFRAPSVDSAQINAQVRRAMADAERTVHDAMRQSQDKMGTLNLKLQDLNQKLGDFAAGGVNLNKDSTVVVKNDAGSVRTMVTKDDTGTYILVADPTKRLTAHDANNKLLFDGPVDSPADQKKVPAKVWKKVQPLIQQLDENPAPALPIPPEPPTAPEPPTPPTTPTAPTAPEP